MKVNPHRFGRGRGLALLAAIREASLHPPSGLTVVRRDARPSPQEMAVLDCITWDNEEL